MVAAMRSNVIKVLKYLVISLFIVMIVISFAQVLFRYVFNNSLVWSEELARYLFVWIVFISCPIVHDVKGHMFVDLISSKVKGKAGEIYNILIHIAIVIFSVFIFSSALELVRVTIDQPSAGLPITMGIVYLSIPIGIALTGLISLHEAIKNLIGLLKGGADNAK